MKETPPVGTECRRSMFSDDMVESFPTPTPGRRLFATHIDANNLKTRCKHIKQNGERCRNASVEGPNGIHSFCEMHLCGELVRRYQVACQKNEKNQGKGFQEAKQLIRLFYGVDLDQCVEWMLNVQAIMDDINASMNANAQVSQSLKSRYKALPAWDKKKVRMSVKQHYLTWKRCWVARELHRRRCVTLENTDEGHEMAYYIYKLAVLTGNGVKSFL